ncbi:MAG: phage major capsid protein [Peptococcaceae bacterium]|nr:MAG: phage major capsid protein [Peptococcaceae bacterium]
MALKQLILSKRILALKSQLNELRQKDAEFATRSEELKTREAELEAAVNEITDETPEEDKATVDEAVAVFEADQEALATDQQANEDAKKKLEDEIQSLQKELDEIDSRLKTPPASTVPKEPEKRKDEPYMSKRVKFLGMTREQRTSLVARDDVKEFLTRVRGMIGQKRAVTGAELTIPEVMLELLRDNMHRYSKLVTKIKLKPVAGKARQNIAGTVPEAVWTEAVAALNELTLSFAQIEVDGYKVGGYIPIPNSTLEDSDENLADEILDSLGQAIGLAIDKAILFGNGSKMPIGIATRLAQTSQPANWDADGPDWTDLHVTNILQINPSGMTAEEFFAALILDLGVAKANYSDGSKFWALNTLTWNTLLSKAVVFNAAGALVSGMNMTMPIVGGDIVILDFLADYDIIGGYGSLFLLAERAGAQLAVSEHALFIEDQTVFRGTARYDGKPVFGEGFVMVNINNAAPTATTTFAADLANTVKTPVALPIAGTYAGGSKDIDLTCETSGAAIYYTTDGSTPDATKTLYNGPITVTTGSTTIKAIAIKTGMTNSAILTAAYTITA